MVIDRVFFYKSIELDQRYTFKRIREKNVWKCKGENIINEE